MQNYIFTIKFLFILYQIMEAISAGNYILVALHVLRLIPFIRRIYRDVINSNDIKK